MEPSHQPKFTEAQMEDQDGRTDWRHAHAKAKDPDGLVFMPDLCIKCKHLFDEGATAADWEAAL